jgi:hypothetical protein
MPPAPSIRCCQLYKTFQGQAIDQPKSGARDFRIVEGVEVGAEAFRYRRLREFVIVFIEEPFDTGFLGRSGC